MVVRDAHRERLDGLRERGPWFFAVFDNAPFAMAVTTMPEGFTVAVNEAFLELFEVTRDAVMGKTSVDLGIADAESRARLAAELRDRGAVRDFECVRHTKGGRRVVLVLNVDPIDIEGAAYVLTSVRDITRASAAAAELRALVDNLPELAWTARPDGFIEFYNRRWYDYTGANYEDMQGWGWRSVHDPAELPRVMERWTRCIATRQPFDQTFPMRRKDGVFRWFLTRVAPIFDDAGQLVRWVGINTDIDDQRRDQEALRDAEQRFRLVFEGAPIGMIIVNAEGRMVLVNASVETVFGYGRQELVGEPIEKLIPMRFREHHPKYREGFVADPRSRAMGQGRELYGLRKDGSEVAVEIGLNPLKATDGTFVLGLVVDVSERKRAEQERMGLVEQLQTLNLDLEERVRSRTTELSRTLREREVLLQEVHHRVKNNLQVISSLMNMQLRTLNDRASRNAIEECQTRVQAIALIHEQLYQSTDYARVPFSEYVRRLAANVFRATGVSPADVSLEMAIENIALAVDKAIPCGLILNELITNALKHGFPFQRRGTIRIELGKLAAGKLRVAVSDNGVGIPAGTDIQKSGSLGMQLVFTLAKQLDGAVHVHTEDGTTFELTFPAGV